MADSTEELLVGTWKWKKVGTINNNQGITSIVLVPKSSDNTGCIRFYKGDEP